MEGTEIISLVSSALPETKSVIHAIGGALLTAIFMRKNTSTQEFERLKAGKMQEVADDLLKSRQMTYTEYYKAGNFLSVAKKADEEYSKMPHAAPTTTYDFDWFVRFYEAVGNVSDEEMQRMWAKILAGEVNKPKSFSLGTLDVMRNLSKQDAELFAKVCKHCIQTMQQKLFLPHYDNYLEKFGITYSEILRLDEIGLINSDGSIGLNMNIAIDSPVSLINQELVMLITTTKENNEKPFIKMYPFTLIGNEVATLIGEIASDDDFLLFAKEVAKYRSLKISVHKIKAFYDNTIDYESADLLND